MVVKGSSRGASQTDVDRLGRHLLARENEVAVILEGCDGSADLAPTLAAMRAVTLGTRSRRALYHASLSLPADEAFDLADARWIEAVNTLERYLELADHQRVVVGHQKNGRRHVHVVWCRAHPVTLRIASDSHSYRKHEACSRELEERWNCRSVVGVHSRPAGTSRPVAAASHADWQAQTRTGIAVSDVAATLKAAWDSTVTGTAFAAALEQGGLRLAIGRRGIVAIDRAGTPHSLPRRLGLRAAEVHARLADLHEATLPTVEACQRNIRNNIGRQTMPKRPGGCQSGRRKKSAMALQTVHRDYWKSLGLAVERGPIGWLVTLSPTTTLVDAGETMTLQRAGEPTDEEIRAMVAAARARGWESIRFFGGSAQFQRRAREIAVASGYPPAAIALECEEGQPKPLAMEMPEHIKKKLMPKPSPAPELSMTDALKPQPAQEMRP